MRLKIGKRYGSWKVIGPHKKIRKKPKGFRYFVLCLCICGKKKFITCGDLKYGKSKSCGCQKRNRLTHGLSGTSIYRSWQRMKQRCYDTNYSRYKDWGGRGIRVCDEWKNSFEQFLQDMGEKPTSKHSLGRIDNNKNYMPANCSWVTPKEQGRNSRKNRLITHNDETHPLCVWSEITGLKSSTIRERIDSCGWSIEKALTTPVQKRRK